jgi:Tol biopolymer transport system component
VVRSQVDNAVAEAVAHLHLVPHDSEALAWSARGDAVYLVGYSNSLDVWKFDVRPDTLAIVGGPHRVTNGSGAERNVTVSRDGTRLAYAEGVTDARLWMWRLDATGSRIVGEPEPVTAPGLHVWRPDLTRDGRTLVFGVAFPGRAGAEELRRLDLGNRSEQALSVPPGGWFTPRWSRDGSRIAYRYSPPGRPLQRSIRIIDVDAGRDWQLTSPVDRLSDNAFDWSADGRYVIACGNRYRSGSNGIAFVPLAAAPSAERRARLVTADTERALWQAMLSPNGRWIAFQAVPLRDARVTQLHIVSADGGEWVPVTDGTAFDDKPRWSDDGRLLYFMSSRRGTPNVWAIPIDPERGRPAGVPYVLTQFDARTSLGVEHIAYAELAVGGGRMVVQVAEPAASIWMIEAARP